jgi:hypothetical protein
MLRPVNALLLLMLTQLPMPAAYEASDAFKEVEKGSYGVLSGREVKDSVYREYRIDSVQPFSVEQLCTNVWTIATSGKATGIKSHKIVRESGELRVLYEQISYPVVSERDYAMSVARDAKLEGGKCRIRFRVTNGADAPPTPKNFVRIETLYGSWEFSPRSDGKSNVAGRFDTRVRGAWRAARHREERVHRSDGEREETV